MKFVPPKQLPEGEHHLLLPRAHVHFFGQVVIIVLGIASFIFGCVVFFLSVNGSRSIGYSVSTLDSDVAQLFSFFAAGFLMGVGVCAVVGWILWRFVKKFRIRFIVSFAISSTTILSGLASVAFMKNPAPVNFTFYFFMISVGVLIGLLSLFYFFHGLSRHLWGQHHSD